MQKKPRWPTGYWERLRSLAKGLPDDFVRPEPLPTSPHRDRIIEEWSMSFSSAEGILEIRDKS